ncbi:hypothetical protein LX32DRAFT_651912 [Colletotrichum zoysiae]|uniref:Uncharacterized protein n=1 Tax=Colletotrichum zoysiae TaxID=1216348 RepID=A0AAD9HJ67_9PEZI|nr:hypothetical protein LX32DRAFT_651912 [Colletotrichum zoysiae]
MTPATASSPSGAPGGYPGCVAIHVAISHARKKPVLVDLASFGLGSSSPGEGEGGTSGITSSTTAASGGLAAWRYERAWESTASSPPAVQACLLAILHLLKSGDMRQMNLQLHGNCVYIGARINGFIFPSLAPVINPGPLSQQRSFPMRTV